MPLLLMLLGFAAATVLGLSEGGGITLSFIGLLIGAVLVVLSQRRKSRRDAITFSIIALI